MSFTTVWSMFNITNGMYLVSMWLCEKAREGLAIIAMKVTRDDLNRRQRVDG